LNYPFASIAQGFRMIEESMREVIVPWDELAKAALNVLRVAEVPPVWAVRRLQRYAVSIPEAPWKAMLATGAIQAVNPKFAERFMEVSIQLYDDRTGLMLTDPAFRTAQDNIM
jgi:CRISPR-associated endonuclease/helicase Cas3